MFLFKPELSKLCVIILITLLGVYVDEKIQLRESLKVLKILAKKNFLNVEPQFFTNIVPLSSAI